MPELRGAPDSIVARLIDAPDGLDEFNRWAIDRGWSDGLPMVPPTQARVEQMLMGTDWPADAEVATMPLSFASATVLAIAANAVMAGCTRSDLPVLIASVQAMTSPQVNLYGAQATTHPCAVMLMLNGPVRDALGVNCGSGAFGPGARANATLGRAVRLMLLNIGNAHPGTTDHSTQGSPAKYTFCFGENEAASPWLPYHVELGYEQSSSVVTVVAAEAPHNIIFHSSSNPDDLMLTVTHTIASAGKNNAHCRGGDFFVCFGPEHAQILAADGWSKDDVRACVHADATIPREVWSRTGNAGVMPLPPFVVGDEPPDISMSDRPEDVRVVVVGGHGLHSSWIPTAGIGRSASEVIKDHSGTPVMFEADLSGMRADDATTCGQ